MSRVKNINWLKTGYVISVLLTLFSGFSITYTFINGNLLHLLFLTPVFAFTYPIALIGTLAYTVKAVLKRKSIFELISMAGVDTGMSSILGGFGQTKEKEEEKDGEKDAE